MQLAFYISFQEEGILRIENFICQLGQEFFEKTPCINSYLFYSVDVDKFYFEPSCCIEEWLLAISLKSVLKNVLSTDSEGD